MASCKSGVFFSSVKNQKKNRKEKQSAIQYRSSGSLASLADAENLWDLWSLRKNPVMAVE